MTMLVLAVRFVTELCALAAFAVWGAESGLLLAVAAPLAAAVLWGRFAAPRSSARLADPARLGFEIVFFGLAAAGLAVADHVGLATALAVVAIGCALAVRAVEAE